MNMEFFDTRTNEKTFMPEVLVLDTWVSIESIVDGYALLGKEFYPIMVKEHSKEIADIIQVKILEREIPNGWI